MAENNFKFKDGRTKLTKKQLRAEALKIKKSVPKGKSWTPLVIQQFGQPYWDDAGDPVKNAADGKAYSLTSGGFAY